MKLKDRARTLALPLLILLPLVVVAALVGSTAASEAGRYDPRYFTAEHLARYDTPGGTALALEQAIQRGDDQLMRELVATRDGPAAFSANPDLILYDLRNKVGDYYNYLYTTEDRRLRTIEHLKFENGRYLVAEDDLFYLVDSGGWPQAFAPLLVTYYVLLALVAGFVRLSRRPKKLAAG